MESYVGYPNSDSASGLNVETEVHDFLSNYKGIIEAFEADSALVITKYAFYKKGFIVELVFSDDDSTMKAPLKQSFQYMKADNPSFAHKHESN